MHRPAGRTAHRVRPLLLALGLLLAACTVPPAAQAGAPGGNTEDLVVWINGTTSPPLGISEGMTVQIRVGSATQSGTIGNISVNETIPAGSVDGGAVFVIESLPVYGACAGGISESVRVQVRDDGVAPDDTANDSIFVGLLAFVDDGGVNGSATDLLTSPPVLDVRCGGNLTIDGDLDLDGSGENQTFDVDTQPPQLLNADLPTYLDGDLDLTVDVIDQNTPVSGIASVSARIDGGNWSSLGWQQTVNGTATYGTTLATNGVSDGPLPLEVALMDLLGNSVFIDSGDSLFADPILDTIDPTMGLDPLPSIVGDSDVDVSGTVGDANLPSDLATASGIFGLSLDTGSGTSALSLTTWDLDLSALPPVASFGATIATAALPDATLQTLTLSGADLAGNVGSDEVATFTLDRSGPDFSLPLMDGQWVSGPLPLAIDVSVGTSPPLEAATASISWNANKVGRPVTSSGTLSEVPPGSEHFGGTIPSDTYEDALWHLSVVATDTVDNSASHGVDLRIDNTDPALSHASSEGLQIDDPLVQLHLTISEANLDVDATNASVDGQGALTYAATTAAPSGAGFFVDPSGSVRDAWLYVPLVSLTEDNHTFAFHTADEAGNGADLVLVLPLDLPDPPILPGNNTTTPGDDNTTVPGGDDNTTQPPDDGGVTPPPILGDTDDTQSGDACIVSIDGEVVATTSSAAEAEAYDTSKLPVGSHVLRIVCVDVGGKETIIKDGTRIEIPPQPPVSEEPQWPATYQVGVPINVTVALSNPNAVPITQSVQLVFNGQVVGLLQVTLAPGERRIVGVPWTPILPGPGSLRIELLIGSVVIALGQKEIVVLPAPAHGDGGPRSSAPGQLVSASPTMLALAVMLIAIVLVTLLALLRRRRRGGQLAAHDEVALERAGAAADSAPIDVEP